MLSCEFCEISHCIFFKESFENPLNGRLKINTRCVYCPFVTFRLFKNDVTHIFWLSIFSVYFVGWEQE